MIPDTPTMKIGDLASRSGVSVRSLRYYETQGLLHPCRDASGHRRFDAVDVERVLAIQELYSAGFCSTVIREILPGVLDPRERDQVRLGAHLGEAQARLRRELRLIERELEQLERVGQRLGVAPHVHVRAHDASHDDDEPAPPAPADHRDRRLR